MPRKAVPALVVGSVIVFVGGGIVDPMLDLQTDPEEWVDQDSQVIEDIGILKDEVKSSSELGIYVQSDEAFSDESVALVHDLAVSSPDRTETRRVGQECVSPGSSRRPPHKKK